MIQWTTFRSLTGLLILAGFLFTGCCGDCFKCGQFGDSGNSYCAMDEMSAREMAGDPIALPIDLTPFSEVIIPYGYELKKSRRLNFDDARIYCEDEYVTRFRVCFSTQDILEVEECRELVVDVVEGLLERLNNSPAAAWFDHSPITNEDLELYFAFDAWFIEYVDPGYIAWMSLINGHVRYISGAIKNPTKDFWDARVEPYRESLLFVRMLRKAEAEDARKNKKPELPGIRNI